MRTTRLFVSSLVGILFIVSACAVQVTPLSSISPGPVTAPGYTSQTPVLSIKIISVTSPVNAGANATLVAQTLAGAECECEVFYKSGLNTDSGLFPKTADSSGQVSWTWKVGNREPPGDWQIIVRASYGGKTDAASTFITIP